MALIVRQRSRLAVLAVLALVGSLLAVSAVPTVAATKGDGEPSNKAAYSACIGAAMDDAGFTDMDGSFAEDAVNCLAHYGITSGTSGGVYSGNDGITRAQMAAFLARASGPAGVELPSPSDQGFTDIAGYVDNFQDVINQVAEVGIMEGRSRAEFAPDEIVSRMDMAVHLAALLDASTLGPGGVDIADVSPDVVEGDPDYFTDIDQVPNHAYTAIRQLYEMGVAAGTTSTTFSPDRPVTRAQMAVFVARTLAHTNARPAGLTIQSVDTDVFVDDTIEIAVSLRDSDNIPIENASVDLFRLKKGKDDPFDNDGECRSSRVQLVKGGALCEIDRSDKDTNPEGNIEADEVSFAADGDTTVWAWTGKHADTFDTDEDDAVMIDISASPAAANIKMTHDATTNTVKFGTEVTFTFQLVDGDGDDVAKKDVAVTVYEEYNDPGGKSGTDTYKTDDSGKFELPYTRNDPNSGKNDPALTVTLTVRTSDLGVINDEGATVNVGNADSSPAATITEVTWDDDDGSLATGRLKLSADPTYQILSPSRTTSHSDVTATVTDQYGSPLKGETVWFVQGDASGTNEYEALRTNSRGQASFDISRAQTDGAGTVTVRAIAIVGKADYTVDGSDNGENDDTDTSDDLGSGTSGTSVDDAEGENTMFHWASTITRPADGTPVSGDVLVGDTANDTVVLNVTNPAAIEYDDDDWFTVVDETGITTPSVGLTGTGDSSVLEKALAAIKAGTHDGNLSVTINEDEDGDGINQFTLTLEDPS